MVQSQKAPDLVPQFEETITALLCYVLVGKPSLKKVHLVSPLQRTIYRKMQLYCQLALLFSSLAFANVEKTVFLAPPALSIPTAHPNLDDLSLIPLTPLYTSVRTRLNASFPTDGAPKGNEHWLLLDGLSPGARYEVRICWLATVC